MRISIKSINMIDYQTLTTYKNDPFFRDDYLKKAFGVSIMEYNEEYRQKLWEFYFTVKYLAENSINLEFNQP